MSWALTVLALSLLFGLRFTHGNYGDYRESHVPFDNVGWLASGDGGGDQETGLEDGSAVEPDENSGAVINIRSTVSPLRQLCSDKRDTGFQFENGYRPQCTETGEYKPMQCYHVTGECWCVDAYGNDIPNTLKRHPEVPTCYPDDGRGSEEDKRNDIKENPDEVYIEQVTTYLPPDSRSVSGPVVEYTGNDEQTPDVVPVQKHWARDLISDPLILAGLIGGAVFVLLVIILILMFVVYRMRKKDEGSYSLDEPRQSFGYTRAKDQEFFA